MTNYATTYDDLFVKIAAEFDFRRLEDRVEFAAFTESLCKYAELTKDAQLAAIARMLSGLWRGAGSRLAQRGMGSWLGRAGMRMARIPNPAALAGAEARSLFNPLTRTVSTPLRPAVQIPGRVVTPTSGVMAGAAKVDFRLSPETLARVRAQQAARAAAPAAAPLGGRVTMLPPAPAYNSMVITPASTPIPARTPAAFAPTQPFKMPAVTGGGAGYGADMPTGGFVPPPMMPAPAFAM